MAIVLGVLIVVSAVQAVQLNNIRSDLKENKISLKSSSVSKTIGGGTPSAPRALPAQVGGC